MDTRQCSRLYSLLLLSYLPAQALLVLFWAAAFGGPGPASLFGQAVMLAWMLGALRYHGLSWRSLLPPAGGRPARGGNSARAVAGGLLLALANLCMQSLASPAQAPAGNVVSGMLEQGAGSYLLLGILLPAVVEELVFRGGFYQSLRREQTAGTAALVSALYFAGLHLSLPHLVSGTVLGLCSAALLERSGSILPCFLLHGCFNSLPLLLSWPPAQRLAPALGMLLGLPAWARGGLALALGGVALLLSGVLRLPKASPSRGGASRLRNGWTALAAAVWCVLTLLLRGPLLG